MRVECMLVESNGLSNLHAFNSQPPYGAQSLFFLMMRVEYFLVESNALFNFHAFEEQRQRADPFSFMEIVKNYKFINF